MDIHSPDNLVSLLRGLEARVRALETAPRATNTSVEDGTFSVIDGSGVTRARFGLLSDGTYGMEVADATGTPISLGAYVFGAQYATVATSQTTTSGTYTDLGTVGPSATVTVGENGKVFLLGGASVDAQSTIAFTSGQTGGGIGYVASGANTIAATFLGQHFGWDVDSSAATSFQGSPAGGVLLTGLNAGSTTFTLKYRAVGSQTAAFANRWIFVQPL